MRMAMRVRFKRLTRTNAMAYEETRLHANALTHTQNAFKL